jgi:hsp70-interacting protein
VYALSGLCKHNSRAVEQLGGSGGWEALSTALEGLSSSPIFCLIPMTHRNPIDSDITVRRKVAFLLNTLLVQSDSELPEPPSNLQAPSSSSVPVHPNSHASMVSDPSSTKTSQFTVEALEDRGLLRTLVKALVAPVPYGEDGESEGDADFEEKVVR